MIPLTDATDDRGVSPVIGAVLLISITVLLAAVVGTTTLGLGTQAMQDPPQAGLSVGVSPASDEITLRHTGGDGIHASQTRIIVSVGDAEATFEPPDDDAVLSVGSTAVIDTAGDDTVDWDGDGANESYTPIDGADTLPTIDDETRVTVQLIDAENQIRFFETTTEG